MAHAQKPTIIITGAAGSIGKSLADDLGRDYTVVGLDVAGKTTDFPLFEIDLASETSVGSALDAVAEAYGRQIAAVIHLAAYFDFSGEENELYRQVNVEGTRHLLTALQGFEVERFIYSSTMLVHAPGKPGERIDEDTPVRPEWAYPESKAQAEAIVRDCHGRIPYLILRLAGLYDEERVVPTLAHQIARIYERDFKSHLYAGDTDAGQAFIHRDDLVRVFRLAVEKRADLPIELELLAGETEAVAYDQLQDRIGQLIHGQDEWATIALPKPVAKLGAWLEEKLHAAIPDAIDGGSEPFIRPFMIDMADEHYALDTGRVRELLGWEPEHALLSDLPKLVAALKHDPAAWYEKNGLDLPSWLDEDEDREKSTG